MDRATLAAHCHGKGLSHHGGDLFDGLDLVAPLGAGLCQFHRRALLQSGTRQYPLAQSASPSAVSVVAEQAAGRENACRMAAGWPAGRSGSSQHLECVRADCTCCNLAREGHKRHRIAHRILQWRNNVGEPRSTGGQDDTAPGTSRNSSQNHTTVMT